MLIKQIDILRGYMASGDWARALSMASRWNRLGKHRDAIRNGHEAMQRPAFQRALGKNPDALIASGIDALKERYP